NLHKYTKLTEGTGENSIKKLTGMYKEWFLDYASYVILERAVPHINDGFKPVHRRILHSMKRMDDGRYNKVANIIGNTMQFHPHGDRSIGDALVQLGQKDLLVDCQGNWGNVLTGDSAAASRYIEARLSKFANDVVFNPKTTEWMLSYDGRNNEPITLPVKFPLLLAQGVEGIAVGLASKILPHNFLELIDASIKYLRGEHFILLPDFPTGGLMDVSRYNDGLRGGVVKVRAKITKNDNKSLTITEIPYGKTTSTIIESIIKANDKNKIKIKKVDDNTAEKVEIHIQLANDVSADKTIDALYAFTDCEVSISPNSCVIMDEKPHFMGVSQILKYNTDSTRNLIRRELEIEINELKESWHLSNLEKIFIEERIYHKIEECTTWESVISTIDKELTPFKKLFLREITEEDIVRLTEIKIKRITKFNSFEADEKIRGIEDKLHTAEDNLANLTQYTIKYYEGIRAKHSKGRERKTEIREFDMIDSTRVAVSNAKLYVDKKEGFFGIGASMKKDEFVCDCSDIDDVIIFSRSGKYVITKVSDKAYFMKDIIYIGVFKRNDERTIYNLLYRDGANGGIMMKRCAIKGITRDREYDITKGTDKSEVLYMSVNPNGEAEVLKVYFKPRARQKKLIVDLDFADLMIKGRSSQGNIFTRYAIHKIVLKEKGISTLAGHQIWLDKDVMKLNSEGRGELLGEFTGNDKTIVVTKGGLYYTAGYDTSLYFPEDVLFIEKYNSDRVYSVTYYDATQKYFYLKRFIAEISEKPQSFIEESKDSYLVDINSDVYPQLHIIYGGANENRANDYIDVDEFIGVKSHKAKGKRITTYVVGKLTFVEPLDKGIEEEELEIEELEDDMLEENEFEVDEPIQGELSFDFKDDE
ncbi:MAG: DNA gyrase/topoisomerase IV subunit A, partial [Rikenellaceae bacterium]